MNRKAIIYTRVSTEDQKDNGFSLQEQEARLRKHCSTEKWDVVAHFQDDHSAKNFNRPAFNKMVADIKAGRLKADILLCVRMDRFSRNLRESLSMIQLLTKYGVSLLTIEANYDLETPENWIPYILNMVLPQVENERRGLNTRRGMRQSRREGRWNGTIPKGYQWERRNGKSHIVPNEEAPLIKFAFEEFAKGIYTIEEVRRQINDKGFPCSRNNFHKLLRNVVYIGKIFIAGWREEPDMTVNGLHEPLVSEDTFYTVQSILTGRRRQGKVKSKVDDHLPLRGFLLCSQCGGKMTGSASTSHTGAKHYYYHCQQGCPERFRAEAANDRLVDYLYQFKIPQEVLNLYYHIMQDVFSKDEVDKKQELGRVDKQIQELEHLTHSVEDKYFKDEIDVDTFNKAKQRYAEQVFRFKGERAKLLSISSEFMNYVDYGFSLLHKLDGYYTDADTVVKQKMLGSIFTEKLIFDGTAYRTPKRNMVLEVLTNNINNLGVVKKEKVAKIDDLSLRVSRRGVEPLLQE